MIVAHARRWRSRAEKEAIVAELNASGSTVSAMARKHNSIHSVWTASSNYRAGS